MQRERDQRHLQFKSNFMSNHLKVNPDPVRCSPDTTDYNELKEFKEWW